MRSVFSSASRTFDRTDNVITYQDELIFCKKVRFRIEDLDLLGHFYHDLGSESDGRSDFHRKLADNRTAIENLHVRKGMGKTMGAIAGTYFRYFTYRIENVKFVTKGKNKAISMAENRMGRFPLVHRDEYSPAECLSLYRERSRIEKAFRTLKTDLEKLHWIVDANGTPKELERTRRQEDILEALDKKS